MGVALSLLDSVSRQGMSKPRLSINPTKYPQRSHKAVGFDLSRNYTLRGFATSTFWGA